jgi:general secretion pathway protein D/MSHA biogenesis protein MshL
MVLAAVLWGCVPQPNPEEQSANFIKEHTKGAIDGSAAKQEPAQVDQLPARYQRPSYLLSTPTGGGRGANTDLSIPVGARITPTGPKPLRLVMQELAKLKSMNISWANDVDQESLVHVTIMPEEDFFEAIDNVLRQLDYFHEVRGNTIVVSHKETKKFHVAMPFMSSSYSTAVGGDVLGNTQGTNMSGNLTLTSNDNKFDIWVNIEKNMDKILEIWSVPPPPVAPVAVAADPGNQVAQSPQTPPAVAEAPAVTNAANSGHSGLGYYTIDRPIGLITVTAPRPLLEKIENYLNNLTGEIYRQVSIEAKIIEVTLSSDNTTGLDWSSLLHTSIGATLDTGIFRPDTASSKLTTTTRHQEVSGSTSLTGPDSSMTINGPNSSMAVAGGGSTVTGPDSTVTTTGPNSSITVVGPNQAMKTASDTVMQSGSMLAQKFVTMTPINFNVLIDAMKEQGHVEVLSNPKISVMNGQPAMISVGENVTYIKSVSSTTDSQTNTISYTVTPDSVMSGLGMGVIATIMDDNQIILSLTPVTSSLTQPIEYRTFGTNQVGLPKVNLREMNTMVRVKNGEMLVVGGLTDTAATYNNTGVAGLGSMPGPLGKLFKRDGTASRKKELIILLRPQIISL